MTASEVLMLQASNKRDSIVHNARVIRKKVRGLTKPDRLDVYSQIKLGPLYPLYAVLREI